MLGPDMLQSTGATEAKDAQGSSEASFYYYYRNMVAMLMAGR